jgi:hypothetical protein
MSVQLHAPGKKSPIPIGKEVGWAPENLLAGPYIPDRLKVRGQMKCSPWSSRLGACLVVNDPTTEKFIVTKSADTKQENV